jgi:hypothetical protein
VRPAIDATDAARPVALAHLCDLAQRHGAALRGLDEQIAERVGRRLAGRVQHA